MHHQILATVSLAIGLGILAQIIAERGKIPAILPLLILGMITGPMALRWFDPASLGHSGLEVLVHLGVAIILFEGGLTLSPKQLSHVSGAIRNLLTIGVIITGVGCALVAHYVVAMPWRSAAIFGAIMTVTGPTVIVPLLRHMIVPKGVRTILVSEGLIIDPIGAVLAYLVLQATGKSGAPWHELVNATLRLAVIGVLLGGVGAALTWGVMRFRVVGEELRNPAVLAILVAGYFLCERFAPQSGVVAVVVMGFALSALDIPDLVRVRHFKGQLTVLLISMLFVLLSAKLDLRSVWNLGWTGPLAVAILMFAVRPLSVLLSVWPNHLPFKDRLVLMLTAPRGIVAAAVASLAALQIGKAEGGMLEGLVYLTIVVTGVWATGVAIVLPRLLGYADDPSRRRAVIVGANALSEALAEKLKERGFIVVLVDMTPWRLKRAEARGLECVCGDARDASTYEAAGVERDTIVIAATTNDELNLLVGELVRDEFGIEHPVVALQEPPEEFGKRSRRWMDSLGPRTLNIPNWNKRFDDRRATFVDVDLSYPGPLEVLRALEAAHPDQVSRVIEWDDGDTPSFRAAPNREATGQVLSVLIEKGEVGDRLLTAIRQAAKEQLKQPAKSEAAPAESPPKPEPEPEPQT